MFDCWLYRTIVEKDGECDLERFVELPFVPFIGLVLNFGDLAISFKAEHVEFVVEDDVFWLFDHDDMSELCNECSCESEDNCCVMNDDCLNHLIKGGWQIKRMRRDWERRIEFEGMFEPEKCYSKALDALIK